MEFTDTTVAILGLFAIVHSVYWIVGGYFLLVDFTGRPKWMHKYKTQPGKNEPVDFGRVKEVFMIISLNQFVAVPFTIGYLYLLKWIGCDFSRTMPSIFELIRDLIVCMFVEEIGFYYTHRILHLPFLYKTVHKRHHSWTAPIGVTAAYAHPFEFFFSNLIPLAVGPMLCLSNIITVWVWWAVATIVTIIHHSGYHLPLLPSPEFHDFHHLRFTGNYGVLGILDWFHATDREFRKSKQFKRNKIIFTSREMTSG